MKRTVETQPACPEQGEELEPLFLDLESSRRILEASHGGKNAVLVNYENCKIEVLSGCLLKDDYVFTKTRRIKTRQYFYHERDLFRHLPFAAHDLRADLGRGGLWYYQALIVEKGQSRLRSVGADDLVGPCATATHFVQNITLGAYRLEAEVQNNGTKKMSLIKKGGVFERCMISESDHHEPVCQNVIKARLIPVERTSSLPKSDTHHLLDQYPGLSRTRRVELSQAGKTLSLPTPGKTTAIVFWSSSCGKCDEELDKNGEDVCDACGKNDAVYDASLDTIEVLKTAWKKANQTKVSVIGVAANVSSRQIQRKLTELQAPFPMVADDHSGRLVNRYQTGERFPSVYLIDENGRVRFYWDGTKGDQDRLKHAIDAVFEN